MTKLILQNLGAAMLVIFLIMLFLLDDKNQNTANSLKSNQQLLLNKQQQLQALTLKEKISDIDLVANIDKFKQFLKSHYVTLELNKVESVSRGMEYLLSGSSIDVLVFAHQALLQKKRVDFKKVSFEKNQQAIIELVVLGVEK